MREITGPEGALNRAREAIDSVSMVRVLTAPRSVRRSPRPAGTPTGGTSRAAPAPTCARSPCPSASTTPAAATPPSPSPSRSSTRPTRRSASGTRASGAASTPDAPARAVDGRPHPQGVVRHGAGRLLAPAALRAAHHRHRLSAQMTHVPLRPLVQLRHHHPGEPADPGAAHRPRRALLQPVQHRAAATAASRAGGCRSRPPRRSSSTTSRRSSRSAGCSPRSACRCPGPSATARSPTSCARPSRRGTRTT